MDDVEPTRRMKAWSDALNDYLFGYDASFPAEFLHASFDGVVLDDLRAATIVCDPMHADRGKSHIARNGMDGYLLLLPCEGVVNFAQRGREVAVGHGQLALISTSEPYSSRQYGKAVSHALVVPGPLMRARKPDVDDHTARRFRHSTAYKLFRDLASSFCRNAPHMDAGALRTISLSIVDMIDIAFDDRRSHRGDLGYPSCRQFVHEMIDAGFRDPLLGLDAIAREADVAPQHLVDALASFGETFSAVLGDRRIGEALRLLSEPTDAGLPDASVARAVGFSDEARFAETFRDLTGLSPGEYRVRGSEP